MNNQTPITAAVLEKIFDRKGVLSESTAPVDLVNLSRALERAANAMEEALEEVWGELRTFGEGPEGEDPIREKVQEALAQYRAMKP